MKLLHGTVFKVTRQDTLKDIEYNFNQMKEAGLDTVVLWPSCFWWEEKKDGYPFNTGKEILKIAENLDIKIIMELAGQLTVMEYIPDYLMKKEYYPVDENGNIIWENSGYGYLNYFHPEVNELICSHFQKTAEAYRDFPALMGYDVFNETIFRSFDKYTMDEFRKWLENKYKTIDKLNEVWERTYTDFSQVDYTKWTWMSVMPMTDYAAFRRDAVGIFIKNWCNAVRKADSTHMLIADNICSMVCGGIYDRAQDDYLLKETVGEVGVSMYPKQIQGARKPWSRWCTYEGIYSASKREGFYIAEMQTHAQAIFNPTTAVNTYELKHWCMEGIASGAKALIYWKWRPFNKGRQAFSRGIVDHKGRTTPRYEIVKELSSIMKKCGVVKPVSSGVAILYDPMCEDFQRIYTKDYDVDQNIYLSSVQGAYEAMFDININCDIVKINEVKNQKAVIVTNHLAIDKKTSDILKEYVSCGGMVILDGKFGITDETSLVNNDIPGGHFYDFVGNDFTDIDYRELDFTYKGSKVKGYYSRDIVDAYKAGKTGEFADGTPAVTVNKIGKGTVISINTHLWYGYSKHHDESVRTFASDLAEEYGLCQFDITSPLKARICENENGLVVFVFNYTAKDQKGEIMYNGIEKDVFVKANEAEMFSISHR